MNWVYVLIFAIGLATEVLWVLAVDAVDKNRTWLVVFTAIAIPGINSVTVTEYVSDSTMVWPMLTGHALGAVGAMKLKAWLSFRTGCPTTGPGSQSSFPS